MAQAAPTPAPETAAFRQADAPDPTAELVAAAESVFGESVRRITAPGGKSRDSLRVHLADRTVIATRRARAIRREREIRFLSTISGHGAPVPDMLGQSGDILFQSDAGSTRLTSELVRREGTDREALVAGSFESLWRLKEAARKSGVLADAPTIAMNAKWLGRFAVAPRRLSKALGIASPGLDWNTLAQSLVALPTEFVKWDARPGNAAVAEDGRLIWFDWEHYGRRSGAEDFAFLVADEFWPVDADTSMRIFEETSPGDGARLSSLLGRFATVQVAARLLLIQRQHEKHGWLKETRARRYDLIGTSPELVQRLCRHGAELAERDPLTRRAIPWFEAVSDPDVWD